MHRTLTTICRKTVQLRFDTVFYRGRIGRLQAGGFQYLCVINPTVKQLIQQVKKLFALDHQIRINTLEYEAFHNNLMVFIYENHFEQTNEWRKISENMIYKMSQFMVASEANEILVQLDSLKRKVLERKFDPAWRLVHPRIIQVSQRLFEDGHYSNAACDAFIEINDRVKKLYMLKNPEDEKIPDGTDLMHKVFSANNPIVEICDLSNETGKNIQTGVHGTNLC